MEKAKQIVSMSKREKLQYAKEEISRGRSREEVAKELGYSTYRSLDNAFRLEGYSFDKTIGNYILNVGNEQSSELHLKTSKADEVIALFAKKKWNAKKIAEKLEFENTRALALYMTSKGYVWNAKRENYMLESPEMKEERDEENEEVTSAQPIEYGGNEDFFEYLQQNENVIRQLIEGAKDGKQLEGIPRFSVPGIFITKSVHMSNQLDKMVRDFSAEKNISQRDIFEVALIRFFQDFGFEREVQTLLARG